MKYIIKSVGTLVAIAAPVAVVVSCNNGEDGKSSTTTNKTTSQGYVQTRPDSDYPQMDINLYRQLDDFGQNDFALQFYKLKGQNYFKKYNTTQNNNNFIKNGEDWYGVYIQLDWRTEHIGIVVMNWHELYDYAHSVASNAFPYN